LDTGLQTPSRSATVEALYICEHLPHVDGLFLCYHFVLLLNHLQFYLKPYTECNGLCESSLDHVALARAGSSGGECWAGYPRAPVKSVTWSDTLHFVYINTFIAHSILTLLKYNLPLVALIIILKLINININKI
jgi:hypothetical protein